MRAGVVAHTRAGTDLVDMLPEAEPGKPDSPEVVARRLAEAEVLRNIPAVTAVLQAAEEGQYKPLAGSLLPERSCGLGSLHRTLDMR
jgi:hypothetical protein